AAGRARACCGGPGWRTPSARASRPRTRSGGCAGRPRTPSPAGSPPTRRRAARRTWTNWTAWRRHDARRGKHPKRGEHAGRGGGAGRGSGTRIIRGVVVRLVKKTYPRYFTYNERPVVLLETPGGGLDCLATDPRTGAFVRAMRYIGELDFNRDADIEELSFEEFVRAVEMYRARKRLGEGTVSALYETMQGLEETAEKERRRLTPQEEALLRSLSMRTHPLFDEHLREQGLTPTPQPTPTEMRIARLFDSVDASGTPVVQRPPVPEEDREPLLRYLERAPIELAARGYDTDVLDSERRAEVPMTYHTDG